MAIFNSYVSLPEGTSFDNQGAAHQASTNGGAFHHPGWGLWLNHWYFHNPMNSQKKPDIIPDYHGYLMSFCFTIILYHDETIIISLTIMIEYFWKNISLNSGKNKQISPHQSKSPWCKIHELIYQHELESW